MINNDHIICNSTITSAPGHERLHNHDLFVPHPQLCETVILQLLLPTDMSTVIVDIDMTVQQVSLVQTLCLILCSASVWFTPWYGMFVCSLLTLATAVSMISK